MKINERRKYMKMKYFSFFVFLLIIMFSNISFAKKDKGVRQSLDTIIESSMGVYTYKIGFLRIIPELKVGIYYDSNALSSNISEVGDVVIETGPAITEKIALGKWALIKGYQNISYVHYKDLDNLRNYPHNISCSIITGRRMVIITAGGGRSKGIVKPTTEADIPVNQLLNYYRGSVKFPLFHKFELELYFKRNEYSFKDYYTYYGKSIDEALRRKENIYILEFSAEITPKTRLSFLTNKEFFNFIYEPVIRDYEGSQFLGGVEITQSAFFSGFIKMGYYRLIPNNPDYRSFKGFIINSMLEYNPIEVLKLKFSLLRRPQFSVFYSTNDHYVQNQLSIDLILALTNKQAISLGMMIGKNEYANPKFLLIEEEIKDKYKEGRMSYIYKLRKDLYLDNGISYFKRDSNFEFFTRKRFMFFINLKYAF